MFISETKIVSCIPRTKYVRGILWFSRRYAADIGNVIMRLEILKNASSLTG